MPAVPTKVRAALSAGAAEQFWNAPDVMIWGAIVRVRLPEPSEEPSAAVATASALQAALAERGELLERRERAIANAQRALWATLRVAADKFEASPSFTSDPVLEPTELLAQVFYGKKYSDLSPEEKAASDKRIPVYFPVAQASAR